MFSWQIESRNFKGNLSGKMKGMKKNVMPSIVPLTKVKILGDNVKASDLSSSSSFATFIFSFVEFNWLRKHVLAQTD